MKYLSSRDSFIKDKNNYKININEGIYSAFGDEDAGPFANVVSWGDSIIGRLVHNLIRKTNVGIDLISMDKVINQLKNILDDIIDRSAINNVTTDEQKVKIVKTYIYSFLYNLKFHINRGSKIEILKSATDLAISDIKNFDDFTTKSELLDKLNKFREFLDKFKKEEDKEEVTTVDDFDLYLNNFKNVFQILSKYTKMKGEQQHQQGNIDVKKGGKYVWKNKKGVEKVVQVIDTENSMKPGDDKKYITDDDVIDQDLPVGKVQVMDVGKTPIATYAVDKSELRKISEAVDNEVTPILNAIKSLYTYFNQDGGETLKDLNVFFNKGNDKYREGFKVQITKIYKRIKSKSGIKEGLNDFLTRPEAIGDKIYDLYQVTKKGSFGDVDSELNGILSNFNETMKKILTNKNSESEIQVQAQGQKQSQEQAQGQVKGALRKAEEHEAILTDESKMLSYQNFLLIKESNVIKDLENESIANEIKKYWESLDVSDYEVTDDEVEDLTKINTDNADKKSIDLDITSVMEIVRCFNRAYKLHTTQVIPTGRSGGRVSNKIFREYTCFGNGTKEHAGESGGPYRNNKLFNKWENAVIDVLGDKKYKPIFEYGATYIEDPNNPRKKIKKDGTGKHLVKFINRLINGDDLYRTGDTKKGVQYQFLKEYFGYKEEDGDVGYTGDAEQNGENSRHIESINLEFKKNITTQLKKGVTLATNAKTVDDKDIKLYFYIREIKGSDVYAIACTKFYLIGGKIEDITKKSITMVTNDVYHKEAKSTTDPELRAFKTSQRVLLDIKGKNIKIKYGKRYDGKNNRFNINLTNDDVEYKNIGDMYYLCEKDKNVAYEVLSNLNFKEITNDCRNTELTT